jgi:hypothetical protein
MESLWDREKLIRIIKKYANLIQSKITYERVILDLSIKINLIPITYWSFYSWSHKAANTVLTKMKTNVQLCQSYLRKDGPIVFGKICPNLLNQLVRPEVSQSKSGGSSNRRSTFWAENNNKNIEYQCTVKPGAYLLNLFCPILL